MQHAEEKQGHPKKPIDDPYVDLYDFSKCSQTSGPGRQETVEKLHVIVSSASSVKLSKQHKMLFLLYNTASLCDHFFG
jgi:hypothetical protein